MQNLPIKFVLILPTPQPALHLPAAGGRVEANRDAGAAVEVRARGEAAEPHAGTSPSERGLQRRICENVEIAAVQKYAHLVELEKCCPTHIFLQNFALIQPRTSPPKIRKILLPFANFELV